jgi:hypothetical protein
MAFDERLTDGTSWSVAGFEWGRPEAPHHEPWVFCADGTVRAGNYWSGTWRPDDNASVKVVIPSPHGDDRFRVVFLSPRWFVAMKRGEPYRLGRLLQGGDD